MADNEEPEIDDEMEEEELDDDAEIDPPRTFPSQDSWRTATASRVRQMDHGEWKGLSRGRRGTL